QPQEITDPNIEISVTMVPATFGGKTPKFKVQTNDGKKWKLKYGFPTFTNSPESIIDLIRKLRGSSDEALSETGTNHAIGAIGYIPQPTYPKKTIRFYFPGAMTAQQVNAKLNEVSTDIEKGTGEAWIRNIRSVLNPQYVKSDESGRAYLELRGVSLELSSGDEQFIGAFDTQNLQMTVQGRAIAIIDALFGNADQKDGNRSLMARLTKNLVTGRDQVDGLLYGLNDMGFGLGTWWTKNAPNLLDWDLVDFDRSIPGEAIFTTFNAFYDSEMFKAITPDDARWVVKRLAQLSVRQLKDFYLAAGYPVPVAALIASKIHYRIAGLVDILGMRDLRVQVDGPGENFVILRGRDLNFDPRKFSVPGYERCFKSGRLIPCDVVPARFTLDSPFQNFSASFTDSEGNVAPQVQFFRDVPGAVVGGAKSLIGWASRALSALVGKTN
ncbi:MAG: hypothetical protein K2X47_07210, partial [Bdellovibrionales bacterium]|nr:hypothetical protein [Bdellovibrionales bacterium]